MSAFSLLGPVNEVFQVPPLSYDLPGDIGAPKNLGEEYRYNTPVLYYAFDQSFLDYFGSNGVRAVEQALAILTNQFNGVSKYNAIGILGEENNGDNLLVLGADRSETIEATTIRRGGGWNVLRFPEARSPMNWPREILLPTCYQLGRSRRELT